MTADMNTSTPARYAEPDEENIHALVHAFYARVRDDALLGPIFSAALKGHWHEHLPKMCRFWASIVLGTKTYQGNVQRAHQPLTGLTPRHFNRWLYLFLDTVQSRYEPAAAVRFMVPALRMAQSLQSELFGCDYRIPDAQQALLDRIAPPAPQLHLVHGDDA
jgi:hemoglobin